MDFLCYQTADSSHNLASRAGLAMLAELIAQLRLSETLDQAMLVPNSALFNTYMLLFHEGGSC